MSQAHLLSSFNLLIFFVFPTLTLLSRTGTAVRKSVPYPLHTAVPDTCPHKNASCTKQCAECIKFYHLLL